MRRLRMRSGSRQKIADAPAAYIQAYLKGTPCCVHLQPGALTKDPAKRAVFQGMTKPVVQLRKALYGHPDSGTY